MAVSEEEKQAIRNEVYREQAAERKRQEDEAAKGCAFIIFFFILMMVIMAIYDWDTFVSMVGAFGHMLK